jgi:hypothetical protein
MMSVALSVCNWSQTDARLNVRYGWKADLAEASNKVKHLQRDGAGLINDETGE